MGKLVTSTLVLILSALVVLVGSLAVAVVLGWMEWDGVWDISGKAVLVAAIVLLMIVVIAGLMALLPRADTGQKGKGRK